MRNTKQSYKTSFTVHGLSRIFSGYCIERMFWLFSLASVLSIAAYLCSIYGKSYWKFEVQTNTRTERRKEMPLPAILVCPNVPLCYKSKKLTRSNYELVADCRSIDLTKITERHQLDECTLIRPGRQITQKHVHLPVRIPFATKTNYIYIAIGDPNLLSSLTTVTSHILKKIESCDIKVSMQKTEYKRLPSPFPSNCSIGEGIGNYFSEAYSKEACIESCHVRNMLQTCGVVMDRWENLTRYVSNTHEINATKYNAKEKESCIKKLFSKMLKNFVPENCYCPPPCIKSKYDPILSLIGDPTSCNSIYMRRQCPIPNQPKDLLPNIQGQCFYFDLLLQYRANRFAYVTETPFYSISNLLADVGSIVGTLAGISVLSFVELLLFFTISIVAWLM